ncbi:MAG: hypothetical protein JWM41_303 [Gemmatimonadetes bacterium]|nr:hypothetical protein [Gemmatimonadota bacterium]
MRTHRMFMIDPYFAAGLASMLSLGAIAFFRGGGSRPAGSVSAATLQRVEAVAAPPRRLGRLGDPVRIAELTDFACPACAAAHAAMWPVIARLVQQGVAHYEVRDLPLPSHQNAIPAAIIAQCVANAGDSIYWRFHDALFAHQREWVAAYPPEPAIMPLAAAAGADTAAVGACVAKEGRERSLRLQRTWQVASDNGLRFTPYVTVNGRAVSWPALEAAVQRVAAAHRP